MYTIRDILKISIPILLEDVLRNLMGTVNTFTLSRVSDSASASVGVANQIINVILLIPLMISAGAGILENQVLGAGKERESSVIMMNSLTLAGLFGLLFSAVIFLFAPQLISFMGLEEGLRGDAETYLRTVGLSLVFQFIGTMLSTHFRCHDRSMVPTAVVIISNAVNLAGSHLVLSGSAGLSGVHGIAAVRLISETLSTAFLLFLFCRQKWGQRSEDLFRMDSGITRQMLSTGGMACTERICTIVSQMLTTRFITDLPVEVLSAKVYVQTISEYPNMFGVSIGKGVQILSGHAIGAGRQDDAYKLIHKAYIMALCLDIPGCLLCRLFSRRIVGLFTGSQEILAIANLLLSIDIITGAARSLNHSFSFGLKSAGYVRRPMIINFISIWTINFGLGYLLAVPAGLGIAGIWIAQASEEWFRGLMSALQWEKKVWQKDLSDASA